MEEVRRRSQSKAVTACVFKGHFCKRCNSSRSGSAPASHIDCTVCALYIYWETLSCEKLLCGPEMPVCCGANSRHMMQLKCVAAVFCLERVNPSSPTVAYRHISGKWLPRHGRSVWELPWGQDPQRSAKTTPTHQLLHTNEVVLEEDRCQLLLFYKTLATLETCIDGSWLFFFLLCLLFLHFNKKYILY